jgi:hypothetical protein
MPEELPDEPLPVVRLPNIEPLEPLEPELLEPPNCAQTKAGWAIRPKTNK